MKQKLKIIVLLIVTLTLVASLTSGCVKSATNEEEEKYVPVEVEKATIGTIQSEVKVNGKVVANEDIAVIPKAMGIVTNVNVELGDFVEEGSILFVVEQEDIAKNVQQAENGIRIANNSVEQAENSLKIAKLNYELNKEKIENAQLNLERSEKLYEDGAISKNQLEQAQLAADEKSLQTILEQVSQAEVAHKQALSQLKQAEIAYEQSLSTFNNTVVKAPISGYVATLNVKEGQIVTSSQVAVTVVDMDKVYVEINVVENIVNKVEVGQQVEVNVPAAFDEYVTSTISYISPTADAKTQLYSIRAYIDNLDKKVKPGMNGGIKLSTESVDSKIVVKDNAVLDKEDKKIVFVVEDNIAIEKEVTIGLDTGDFIEIKEGLKEGEVVIVEGQHYVENGGKVKVVRGE